MSTTDAQLPPGWAECGTCGRAWNDAEPTSITPTPSGRCPFEYDHQEPTTSDYLYRVTLPADTHPTVRDRILAAVYDAIEDSLADWDELPDFDHAGPITKGDR
jgi:hypothetical protein